MVPKTTLISAANTETSTVIHRASSAAGAVTASQNPLQPSSKDCTVIAASGSSTMTLSHSQANPTVAGLTPVNVRARPRNPPGGAASGGGAPVPGSVVETFEVTVCPLRRRSW